MRLTAYIIAAVVAALAIRWSLLAPFFVATASMEPSLRAGDRILALKMAYQLNLPFTEQILWQGQSAQRGDVIVFRSPANTTQDYVKRVIGVGGDRIRIVDERIYLNGVVQERQLHDFDRSALGECSDPDQAVKSLYLEEIAGVKYWTLQLKSRNPTRALGQSWPANADFTVPAQSVFVLGDNRDSSADSRSWGVVPLSYIHGKVIFVLWTLAPSSGASWFQLRFSAMDSGLTAKYRKVTAMGGRKP